MPPLSVRFACLVATALAATSTHAADVRPDAANNRGVVEIETASSNGISVRMIEEIADVVDDGATRRVLAVVGKGSQQNLIDLKLLHGIDMAILQTDLLDQAHQQGRDSGVTYIAKLYNEEFHLLARSDIKSVGDLAGQTVNVDLAGGGTAASASRLFGLLKVNVITANDDQGVALEKLKKGRIAALAFVAGKPAPLFRDVKAAGGLHFLAIPLKTEVSAAYVPTRLTAADYPELVPADKPVDTVAIGAVLAVANLNPASDRYRNVANFVDAFFTKFETLLEPGHHPKWREVNIAADLPGWRRFPAAEQWLKNNAGAAKQMSAQDFKAIFSRFVDERRQLGGGAPLSQQQKDELFRQFERWQSEQKP